MPATATVTADAYCLVMTLGREAFYQKVLSKPGGGAGAGAYRSRAPRAHGDVARERAGSKRAALLSQQRLGGRRLRYRALIPLDRAEVGFQRQDAKDAKTAKLMLVGPPRSLNWMPISTPFFVDAEELGGCRLGLASLLQPSWLPHCQVSHCTVSESPHADTAPVRKIIFELVNSSGYGSGSCGIASSRAPHS